MTCSSVAVRGEVAETGEHLLAHVVGRRAGQDAAVDLDHRLAGDDVVLDPRVDDVRADGVAQQCPQRPRVHRVAEAADGGLAAARVLAPIGRDEGGLVGGSSALIRRGTGASRA